MKIRITDILLVAVVVVPIGIFVQTGGKPPFVNDENILEKASIEYPAEYNFHQTINDCGPYNVAAMVRILTGKEVDSAKFAESIGNRLPNKYVLPRGVEKQLQENGLEIETPNMKAMSENDKILYLHERLSRGRPVIILGEKSGFEHYLTVLGFDSINNEFYVYDSSLESKKNNELLTVDNNGRFSGNLTMSNKDLLSFWRGGGMYGLYKWYAVSAWPKDNSNFSK